MNELNKIKDDISRILNANPKTGLQIGYNDAIKNCLAIIDTAIAEQRVPSGEWETESFEDEFWFGRVEGYKYMLVVTIREDGLFYWKVKTRIAGITEKYGDGFPTLLAAQLAAEDAMKKMEEKV